MVDTPAIMVFTIADSTDIHFYEFEEGMTWEDWTNSEYNTGYKGNLFDATDTFGVYCNVVENGHDMCHYLVDVDGNMQFGSDAIIEEGGYSFDIVDMGPA
jgi:hypothetical protein